MIREDKCILVYRHLDCLLTALNNGAQQTTWLSTLAHTFRGREGVMSGYSLYLPPSWWSLYIYIYCLCFAYSVFLSHAFAFCTLRWMAHSFKFYIKCRMNARTPNVLHSSMPNCQTGACANIRMHHHLKKKKKKSIYIAFIHGLQ